MTGPPEPAQNPGTIPARLQPAKPLLQVISDDGKLLAINKPAGLVCHPSKQGELSSLIGRVRLHLGLGTRPHLLNRLDRETSGVVLVARCDEIARSVRRLLESRQVQKEYLAVVHGHVADDQGRIDAPLGKDEQSKVAIKDCVRPDGLPAVTDFEVVRRFEFCHAGVTRAASLLRVRPETGRKHQIRIHLAHVGYPIVGDKLYGGDETLYLDLVEGRLTEQGWARLIVPFHALHARSLEFRMDDQGYCFTAEPEPWFCGFLRGEIPPPGDPER